MINSFVFLNNQFVRSEEATISVFDHGLLYGDGVYDSLRGYKNKIWNYKSHIDRFFDGAKALKLKIPYSKAKLQSIIEELLNKNQILESRIRIYLSRGINNYDFTTCLNPTLIISAIPIPIFAKNSGKLISLNLERPMPDIKSSSLIIANIVRQECQKHKAVDALLINRHNFIPEGSISNYFIIKKNTLYSPATDALPGTTKQLVLRVANKLKIPIKIQNLTLKEIYKSDELFITSVYKHILPIHQIDNNPINSKKIGPLTIKLQNALQDEYNTFKLKTDQCVT